MANSATEVTTPQNFEFTATIDHVSTTTFAKRVSINFAQDVKFAGYDENGNETTKNSFTKTVASVLAQCGESVGYLKIAQAVAMGYNVNPIILALCLNGAKVKVKATWHDKAELRDENDATSVYGKDTYTYDIVEVKPNIDEATKGMLMWYIQNKPIVEEKAVSAPNPFNVAV